VSSDTGRGPRHLLNGISAFPVAVLLASAALVIGVSLYENLLAGLIEAAFLLIGVWGAYVLGQQSVPGGDAKPHARKAYRRMATLYGQLYALTERAATERDAIVGKGNDQAAERAYMALDFIGFSVGQNLAVVNDAMEDWADVVPDEVADLRRELVLEPENEQQTASYWTGVAGTAEVTDLLDYVRRDLEQGDEEGDDA
jgi:hypothetical protein